MPDDKLHKLSAYRLEVNDIEKLSFSGFKEFAKAKVTLDKQSFEYRLLIYRGTSKTPSWFPAFEHLNPDPALVPKTRNPGFILLVKVKSACYSVTGGVGHLHLREKLEVTYQFGVELAKRILSEKELRSLAQRDTGGNVQAIDRHFRGRYSPKNDINNLRRILKNVRGQLSKAKNPLLKKIGSSIQGSDALTVNGAKTFNNILQFIATVEDLWQKGKDRIIIPSLEKLDKTAHAGLIAELKAALIEWIVDYDPDEPQQLFLEGETRDVFNGATAKWALRAGKWNKEAASVSEVFEHARDRLAQIAKPAARLAAFDGLKLSIEYDDGASEDDVFYRFICGDIIHKSENYFLDHRAWFHASDEYLKTLTAQLDNIECVEATSLGLNRWDKAIYADEDAFNLSHGNYVLLDKRFVKLPDENGIEFCDLFGSSGNRTCLIHVKEACGAELRALFAQGSVSAALYSEVEAFRDVVHGCGFTIRNGIPQLTAAQTQLCAALKSKQIRELTVIYAVRDETPSHGVAAGAKHTSQFFDGTLSTFAKVDLLNHCQTLRGLGYAVALTRLEPYPAVATALPTKKKAP